LKRLEQAGWTVVRPRKNVKADLVFELLNTLPETKDIVFSVDYIDDFDDFEGLQTEIEAANERRQGRAAIVANCRQTVFDRLTFSRDLFAIDDLSSDGSGSAAEQYASFVSSQLLEPLGVPFEQSGWMPAALAAFLRYLNDEGICFEQELNTLSDISPDFASWFVRRFDRSFEGKADWNNAALIVAMLPSVEASMAPIYNDPEVGKTMRILLRDGWIGLARKKWRDF
jgi:hypothetical protein